jgi:hypothetical protein
MIFDYLDIASKRSLALSVRRWLESETNLESLKRLCDHHNIRGTKVATEREDEDMVRALAMLAAGIIVPLTRRQAFGLAVRSDWQVPSWVFDERMWGNVMSHVEQILEAVDMPVPAAPLLPAVYARFRRHNLVASIPGPPHVDLERDLRVQEQLKLEGGAQERQWVNSAKRGLKRR